MANTFVKDVMKKNVISIDGSLTLKDAAQMMNDSKVGSVIITKENIPVGIFTERDFVRKIVVNEKSYSTHLIDVMSSPLISVGPNHTVWDAAEIMKKNKIHKIPVVDNNELVGIITATDIVKLCSIGSDSTMRHIADEILIRMKHLQ